jgi:hypothetical protein
MLAAFSEIHLDVSRQNAEGGYGEEGGAVGRELQVLDARTVAGEHGDRADHNADIVQTMARPLEHRPRRPHVAEAGLEPEEGADGSHATPAEEDDVEMDGPDAAEGQPFDAAEEVGMMQLEGADHGGEGAEQEPDDGAGKPEQDGDAGGVVDDDARDLFEPGLGGAFGHVGHERTPWRMAGKKSVWRPMGVFVVEDGRRGSARMAEFASCYGPGGPNQSSRHRVVRWPR